jgi:phage tail sheath protein FI
MPINPTYPGVYIEELENPVKTIVGVSTSVTAFIGRALAGPVNNPMLIHSFSEFESMFGGLWKKSTMSYSVFQYFLNGGHDAIIVRVVHSDAVKNIFTMTGGPSFEAKYEGAWANNFSIQIDHDVDKDQDEPDPTKPRHLFNLKVLDTNRSPVEEFLNVSHKEDNKRYVVSVLNDESEFINVPSSMEAAIKATLPPTGTYSGATGNDGSELDNSDLKGSNGSKTGIHALDRADIFNLLCIHAPHPEGANEGTDHYYSSVYTDAAKYCNDKRAMLIVDPPNDWNSPRDAMNGIELLGLSRTESAVIYYPRIVAPDPKEEDRYRVFSPSGAIAGIIAKTDAQRGIWKAPAGIDAILTGVPELEYRMTDDENGMLNPLGINCFRVMPATGRVAWGARTMKGADRLANQWKYLPVRRMALYIEESLYRGTQWAVFEPNDEPLWSQIRLNVGAFMQDLFLKGAFQGTTPKQAYLVKCDIETTTKIDIERGIVNIVVGFAPLKPAEFVIVKITQLAGQSEGQ